MPATGNPQMKIFYTLVIKAYSLIVRLAGPFSSKAAEWTQGRKDLLSYIESRMNDEGKSIWFHCASLGEFEQGRPVMESFRQRNPGIRLVVTFFSPSGYNVRKNWGGADHVYYLPADTPANARRFIEAVNPVAAVFVKYDFWYNYLSVLNSKKIPVILISGIFRRRQHFFKWYGGFFRKMLGFFSHLFVQDSFSEELLVKAGIRNVTVSGDTRFDRVAEIAASAVKIPVLKLFTGDSRVMVCGSTWPADEEIIARYRRENSGRMKYIIAPHEVEQGNIDRIKTLFGSGTASYSSVVEKTDSDTDVMIIDTIGILSSAYRYATIALIGGGFGRGIHNILEAAAWSKPVIFGPNYGKFREACELIELKGAFSFSGFEQFARIVDKWVTDDASRGDAASICEKYVAENQGSAGIITAYLSSICESPVKG